MIPKENRINKKLFDEVFKGGYSINTPIFLFKYKKNLENKGYFAFVAPKTVAKSAVKRNYLRRKGYNLLKNKAFPAITGIFIYKKGVDLSIKNEILSENIDFIVKKIK